MIELLVAVAVFTVIGGAALMLVRRHIPLFTTQQNQAGLNMAVRNAATQMQIDAVNAGSGYYTGANIPSWPVGLTIQNNNVGSSSSCFNSTTFVYGANCFDSFSIIMADPNTLPARGSSSSSSATQIDTSSGIVYLTPIGTTTASAYAGQFKTNDRVLFINQGGTQLTTSVLTANGQVVGSTVKLTFTATNTSGATTADPLHMTDFTPDTYNTLGSSYSPTTDFVLRLSSVTYAVDTATDANNPTLTRQVDGQTPVPIAEQVIGFKIGAYTIDGTSVNDTDYQYNRPGMGTPYKWGTIRSIRVSLIGRTQPNPDRAFRNSFDQGPYKIEAVSVVINPRNLSMND
jgi:hypothetical protein